MATVKQNGVVDSGEYPGEACPNCAWAETAVLSAGSSVEFKCEACNSVILGWVQIKPTRKAILINSGVEVREIDGKCWAWQIIRRIGSRYRSPRPAPSEPRNSTGSPCYMHH